jgi:crotonobetaine/carnitine-CoA ligase
VLDGALFPQRHEAVLRYVLETRAEEAPDRVFAYFDGGVTWTRAELLNRTCRIAASLHALGVKQGDHVVCWLPNGPDVLQYLCAVNYLGAVFVPINVAYRGSVLTHVLQNSGATIAVVDHALVHRLGGLDSRGELAQVITVGGGGGVEPVVPGLRVVRADDMPSGGDEPPDLERPIEPWDTQAIMYTSGTTGPSKGVLCSYMQAYSSFGSRTMTFISADDRFLINMPFFHVGGMFITYGMLINGGSVAIVDRFEADQFWRQIGESKSTIVFLLGVMATFIERLPARGDDSDNTLLKLFMVPLVENVEAFSKRFAVDVYTIYNMTELSAPIISDVNPANGTCGRSRLGVEVRLVDSADLEVPVGGVGEIVVRSDLPWVLNHGYYKMPEATVSAWRNGWFHTGDSARQDESGLFYFVDRLKDSIRRSGENISSQEVEAEILLHPDIREAAVVAVPSEIAEDEVLAVVAAVPGRSIDPEGLLRFLEPRLAHFMLPRYIRILDELPKTETAKVRKTALREIGVTDDTWDRKAAGVRLTRQP